MPPSGLLKIVPTESLPLVLKKGSFRWERIDQVEPLIMSQRTCVHGCMDELRTLRKFTGQTCIDMHMEAGV